jgi:hypothetical protein
MWITSLEYNQNSNLFSGDVEDPNASGVFLTKKQIVEEVEKIKLLNNDGEYLLDYDGSLARQSGVVKREWKSEDSAIKYRDLVVTNYPELIVTIEEITDN